MRILLRIAIVLAILAALYVAADFGLKAVAQSKVASALQTKLDLSKKPEVSLGGFPFLIRALDGHLDAVTLDGTNLSAGTQPLGEVRLTLRDVRFSATALITGKSSSVRFAGSHGTAELTGDD